ncbi:hypothetical protein HIM_08891 [Hirsutella minnesotensis 3608]|uniref:Uncharacterized protein n=1 Tax=Hirsutella minnesotensis 3608 TaxID=1043627 RepID=A0A0F8A3E6_9HYPO|nr:hypothetical protein HIM_08891 [Hirsutella minnesotensis 3608]
MAPRSNESLDVNSSNKAETTIKHEDILRWRAWAGPSVVRFSIPDAMPSVPTALLSRQQPALQASVSNEQQAPQANKTAMQSSGVAPHKKQ